MRISDWSSDVCSSDLGGAVVNVSSTCGMKALGSMASYSASKAAGQHFSAVAAMEGAQYGVRVNSVVPGFVRTPAALGWADGNPEPAVVASNEDRKSVV